MNTTTRSRGWQDRAACRDLDFSLFFFDGAADAPGNARQVARAKRVCCDCPVRPECLGFGEQEPAGIYGGATPEERQADRRRALRTGRAAA